MLIANEHVLTACESGPEGAHIIIGEHDMAVEGFVQFASGNSSNVSLDLAVIKILDNLIEPWVMSQDKFFYRPESWPLQPPERNNMFF